MNSYKLISATNTECPVDLTGFKNHIGFSVEDTSRDAHFTALLQGITDASQRHTGRQFLPAEYELQLPAFPDSGEVEITRLPVTGVSSVNYFNAGNEETALASGTDYYTNLVSNPAKVVFINTPATYANRANAVNIRFTAGYATVPPAIKLAIKMAAANAYINPGDRTDTLNTVSKSMLRPYKVR